MNVKTKLNVKNAIKDSSVKTVSHVDPSVKTVMKKTYVKNVNW